MTTPNQTFETLCATIKSLEDKSPFLPSVIPNWNKLISLVDLNRLDQANELIMLKFQDQFSYFHKHGKLVSEVAATIEDIADQFVTFLKMLPQLIPIEDLQDGVMSLINDVEHENIIDATQAAEYRNRIIKSMNAGNAHKHDWQVILQSQFDQLQKQVTLLTKSYKSAAAKGEIKRIVESFLASN